MITSPFSLIICTYERPESLIKLLKSVQGQTLYPDEILIIDGSLDNKTEVAINQNAFDKLRYFHVEENNRGLTKQRNFGILNISDKTEIVCYLDDDTVLNPTYFDEIIKTFQENKEITGVGGIAINENKWKLQDENVQYNTKKFYLFEKYYYKEGLRNVARNYLGLSSNLGPGKMPSYSHGRTCGFPLTGKTYEVDLLIGMSMAFRKRIFDQIKFSKFFEGYGLYEDADFSLRALQFGKNVINTNANLSHFHDPAGRPNQFRYGKMVVRNGWYVWRIKNPKPNIRDRFKWNSITLLLLFIRFINIITSSKRKEAFTETFGRISGYISLMFYKPS